MRVNWKLSLLLIELLLALAFFSFISVTDSSLFGEYRRDISHKEEYCNSQAGAEKQKYEKDCEGFLYRTVNDPVAVFTAGLFVFTFVLAIATGALIFVTLFGILEQGRSTERLFVLDQRPWLKVTISIGSPMFVFSENSTNVNLIVDIKNIGKTPAFDVVLPFFFLNHYQGEPDLVELANSGKRNVAFQNIRDEHRKAVKSATIKRTITLHAGDDFQIKSSVYIQQALVEKMWENPGKLYNLIYLCIPYKGGFSTGYYETTIVGSIRYGLMGTANLPRNAGDLEQIDAVHALIKEHGQDDIRDNILSMIDTSGALSVIT